MGEFRDHVYRLMLDRKLCLAIVQLQAERRLGRSFSAMLPFVEGLHSLGYLSDGDYEVYKAKYSVVLDNTPLTPTQNREQETKENRDRQLNRHYKAVLEQWATLKEQSKKYHLKKAEVDKRLKYARLVLKRHSQEKEASQ